MRAVVQFCRVIILLTHPCTAAMKASVSSDLASSDVFAISQSKSSKAGETVSGPLHCT